MAPKYTDAIANAFSEAKAWRFTCYLLSALLLVAVGYIIYQSRNEPIVLVPYDLAVSKGNIKVPTNGATYGVSPDYMEALALGDMSLILSFTPANVEAQYARFQNRLTSDLFATQQSALKVQAKTMKDDNITQAFFPERAKMSPDGAKVEVTGLMIRWMGDKESIRSSLTYVLTYKAFKGYYHVSNMQIKESK